MKSTMTPEEEAAWIAGLPTAKATPAQSQCPAVLEGDRLPDALQDTPCIHWWRIATPDGPWCRGTCKRCGAERMFSASGDEVGTYWGDTTTTPQHRMKAGEANKRKHNGGATSASQKVAFYGPLQPSPRVGLQCGLEFAEVSA